MLLIFQCVIGDHSYHLLENDRFVQKFFENWLTDLNYGDKIIILVLGLNYNCSPSNHDYVNRLRAQLVAILFDRSSTVVMALVTTLRWLVPICAPSVALPGIMTLLYIS